MIELSRHVEATAFNTRAGTLHTGLQRLRRLDDEFGTHEVYHRLGDTPVDTHVYGAPPRPDVIPGVAFHADAVQEIKDTWFVAFHAPDQTDQSIMLIAEETHAGVWEGLWTYDTQQVQSVIEYLTRTYVESD